MVSLKHMFCGIQEPGTVPGTVSQYSTQATEGQVESDDSDEAMVSRWVCLGEDRGAGHISIFSEDG